MKKIGIIVLAVAYLLTLSSCGQKKKDKAELEIKKSEIESIVVNYVYPLPSSFELMEMLNEIEAAFIIGISNPAENVDIYKTDDKKALNLGVFLSDLSYAAIYNRKQAVQDYLISCEKIASDLRVDDAFENDFITTVSNNLENRDTLVTLVTKATQDVYADFHRKGDKDLSYLMVAGAWVEAMNLTLIMVENTPLNEKILNTIIFQHSSLLETVMLLEEVKEEPTVAPIYTAMLGIKNTFNQEDPSSLTMDQLEKLTKQVGALRSIIVE